MNIRQEYKALKERKDNLTDEIYAIHQRIALTTNELNHPQLNAAYKANLQLQLNKIYIKQQVLEDNLRDVYQDIEYLHRNFMI